MPVRTLILAILLSLSLSPALRATHIVGGEMNYTCLGNNNYEITLTIFRDCFYGNPLAWFDDPASIGVFDAGNDLLFQVLLPLMGNDTLDPVLQSECFVAPPDVCVHTTTYRTIVNLPPIPGGYQLAYQRCCRNQTILNIVDPLDSGATYGVTISETALLECNSNPKFQTWPPIYICVGEPISFDQSAIDADGDSIVYRLCDPWLGATPDIPMPQPPNPPPYEPVNWVDPPYNTGNMLNGSPGDPPLQIDAQTGLLTGLPNTIGQFVVGICVEEYRNGVLISTTRRDFQYNVGLCGQASSAFFAPALQCESLTVEFENESQGAANYLWLFNDPGNPGATSTEVDPVFSFSDTGYYEVVLIAEPNTPCADTFSQGVRLQYNSLFPDFSYEFAACTDSLLIEVNDLSYDTLFEPVAWSWELLPTGETAEIPDPFFYVDVNQEYTLHLTVTASNGCVKTAAQTFPVDLIEVNFPADTLFLCAGDAIPLNPFFNPDYTYEWAPAETLSDPLAANPVAMPEESTTYEVTITDADGFCQIERQVTILVSEPLVIDLPEDTTICDAGLWLSTNSPTGVQFEWYSDDSPGVPVATTDSLLVEPLGEMTYFALVRDTFGCLAYDSVTVTGNGINLFIYDPGPQCTDQIIGLLATVTDPQDTVIFQWTPDTYIQVGADGPLAVISVPEPGGYTFFLESTNQFGCTRQDSITLTIVDQNLQPDFFSEQQCSGYQVRFSGQDIGAPYYVWHFGDPADPDAVAVGGAVTHAYSGPGTYEVIVTYDESVPCSDTLIRQVVVSEPPISLDFEWDYETCSDSALIRFTDLSINENGNIIAWDWAFGTIGSSTEQHPQLLLSESAGFPVTLIVASDNGCVDTLVRPVEVQLIEEALTEEQVACPGDTLFLNPEFNPEYTYTWSPAEVFADPASPNPGVSPDESAEYSVLITDSSGDCTVERRVSVLVPPPILFALPPDTVICTDQVTLSVESDQSLLFEWSESADFSTAIAQGLTATVEPGRPTTYFFRATDGFGCEKIDSVTVGSYGINVLLDGEQNICIGDTLRLEVINQGEGPLIYNWSPASAILSDGDTAMPLVAPREDQEFEVTIRNTFGCELDTSIRVSVLDFVPPLEVTADPDTLYGPGLTQLTATQNSSYIYTWEPSTALFDPDIFNPVAVPEVTTTYTVHIRTEEGCTNEASVTVYVLSLECRDPFIFVPNSFSPNGDGLNDELYVRGNSIDELYFIIYNRWGEQVFETRSPDEGWDGTFRGEPLPPDAFGYYLEVKCFNGDTFTQKGNISLLR